MKSLIKIIILLIIVVGGFYLYRAMKAPKEAPSAITTANTSGSEMMSQNSPTGTGTVPSGMGSPMNQGSNQ
jgi:uncharacterized protein YxeA